MRRFCLALVAVLVVSTGCSKSTSTMASAPGTVKVVSSPADMVSGGDTLVSATVPSGAKAVAATIDGRRATATVDRAGTTATLWVTGLRDGKHTVAVTADGSDVGKVEVTDHPITGPIFSGPHQKPFVCTTKDFDLGAPTDADCSAPTKVQWLYYTTDPSPKAKPKPLADPTVVPADVAMIDRGGKQVPFIVREERGVIDRSIYLIHTLEPKPDPTATGRAWDSSAWNKRLIYRYGGGCGTGYTQGHLLGGEIDRDTLEAGYADATSTLNVMQTTCNDVLSAEVTMMVKERFIERYGLPVHTIGQGGSGGSIQQHLIAQNYPGLLDALNPTLPFPDAITIAAGVSDCGLLRDYFGTGVGSTFTDAQRLAVQGHGSLGFCRTWITTFLDAVNPSVGCAKEVTPDLLYDAVKNPTGARCTLQDANANLYPVDPTTGFSARALDNVGVQYGLEAVKAGTITVDQFLDLNEHVGGYDIDGRHVPAREVAPKAALEASYGKGRVLLGTGGIRRVPVIHGNPYTDLNVDIHDRFRAFSVRDRMSTDGKRATNEVLYTRQGTNISELVDARSLPDLEMIQQLDRWLDAVDVATRGTARPTTDAGWQKLLGSTRPKGLTDNCVTPDGQAFISDDVYETDNPCTKAFVIHGDPRTAAGAPRSNEIIKCQLTKVDDTTYGTPLTPDQQARLARIFPDGVCDWTRPSVGQVPLQGTWLRYGSS